MDEQDFESVTSTNSITLAGGYWFIIQEPRGNFNPFFFRFCSVYRACGCGNTRRGGGSGVPGNKTAQKEARRRHSRQEIKTL